MAKIQLVVEIEERYYEIIKNDVERGMDYMPCVLIANGTPLPKGHGRIIDESEITSFYYHEETAKSEKSRAITLTWNVIDGTDAPTIIEADKEG